MLDLNLPRLGGDQIMKDLRQLDEVPSPFHHHVGLLQSR